MIWNSAMLRLSTLEFRKCNLSVTCMGPFRGNRALCLLSVAGLSVPLHGTKGDSFDNFIPNCPFCPITKIMREPSRGEFLHCFKNSCCRKVIQQELGSHIFYLKENSSRRGMKGFHTRLILKLSFKTVAHLSHTSDPSAFCFPTVFRLMRNLTGYPPRLFIIFGIMHVLVGHVFRG